MLEFAPTLGNPPSEREVIAIDVRRRNAGVVMFPDEAAKVTECLIPKRFVDIPYPSFDSLELTHVFRGQVPVLPFSPLTVHPYPETEPVFLVFLPHQRVTFPLDEPEEVSHTVLPGPVAQAPLPPRHALKPLDPLSFEIMVLVQVAFVGDPSPERIAVLQVSRRHQRVTLPLDKSEECRECLLPGRVVRAPLPSWHALKPLDPLSLEFMVLV
jgi:hypothetical protein